MKNKNTMQVILMPKGYGKATKEVREYIHLLEQEIKRQEKSQVILDNQNADLKEENISLREQVRTYYQPENELNKHKYGILQERIDKAIEYINDMCLFDDGYANYGDDLRPAHIVDILNGEDND